MARAATGVTSVSTEPKKQPRPQAKTDPNAWECFIGHWSVGSHGDSSKRFDIVLHGNHNAQKAPNRANVQGTWEYVNGDAIIQWKDGIIDVLRCVPGGLIKMAFYKGLSNSKPDSVSDATKVG